MRISERLNPRNFWPFKVKRDDLERRQALLRHFGKHYPNLSLTEETIQEERIINPERQGYLIEFIARTLLEKKTKSAERINPTELFEYISHLIALVQLYRKKLKENGVVSEDFLDVLHNLDLEFHQSNVVDMNGGLNTEREVEWDDEAVLKWREAEFVKLGISKLQIAEIIREDIEHQKLGVKFPDRKLLNQIRELIEVSKEAFPSLKDIDTRILENMILEFLLWRGKATQNRISKKVVPFKIA